VTQADRPSNATRERVVPVGDLKICYQSFGANRAPPLLLIMGLASQMIIWDEEFCEQLAAKGFRVIRFDNRDVGHSTIMRGTHIPSRLQLMTRSRKGPAYSLNDMAADTVGLLDRLKISAAHVVGADLGGMIAQLIAINSPDRVLSLVSIMSSTGDRHVGQPERRIVRWLLRKSKRERAVYIDDQIETLRLIGTTDVDFEEERKRERAGRHFDRGLFPAGATRQMAAMFTAADRTEQLRQLHVPTTVIHGDADLLVNVSGGRATADAIPDAKLIIIPGMGHDLPREIWPQVIDAIVENAALASKA
jgi:pimeloyl-ACP methyl ester carboxylesterase